MIQSAHCFLYLFSYEQDSSSHRQPQLVCSRVAGIGRRKLIVVLFFRCIVQQHVFHDVVIVINVFFICVLVEQLLKAFPQL